MGEGEPGHRDGSSLAPELKGQIQGERNFTPAQCHCVSQGREGGKRGWKSQFRQPAGCVDLREVLPSLKPQFPHMTKSREGMELMCRFKGNVCKILSMSPRTWQVPRNVSDCHRACPRVSLNSGGLSWRHPWSQGRLIRGRMV